MEIAHLSINPISKEKELVNSSYCLMDYKVESPTASEWGTVFTDRVIFPQITLYGFRVNTRCSLMFNRSRRHIMVDRSGDFLFSLPKNVETIIRQNMKTSTCRPKYFRLLSTSIPFSSRTKQITGSNTDGEISARISGSVLRQLLPEIDNYPNLVVPIRGGIGKIAQTMILAGLMEGKALSRTQAADFGNQVVRSIADAILDVPDAELRQAKVHETSYERVSRMAKDFIMWNLSNPDLDIVAIASHCQVSKTYLHMAFASSSSTSVGAYIRESRLQQCRANLLNENLRHHPISEIIMKWGFFDAASFSQMYKARFGKTPSQERNSLKACGAEEAGA